MTRKRIFYGFMALLGVTLIRDIPEEALLKVKYPIDIKAGYLQDTILWPLGDILPDTLTGIDMDALGNISQQLVTHNAYNGNAFAFMVLHKGIPVAEAYKPQFNKETLFLSWSNG